MNPPSVRAAFEVDFIMVSVQFGRFLKTALRAVALIASLGCTQTFAQTQERPSQLTVFAGQGFGGTFRTESDTQIRLDDDTSWGIIFDYDEDANAQWEFLYLEQRTAADTSAVTPLEPSVKTDIQYLQGGGTFIGSGTRVRPYLAGTAGLTRIDPYGASTRSDLFWSLSIGGGVQFAPSERLGFRLEGRLFGTFVNSNSAIYCGSGVEGGQCLFKLQGEALWQSHLFAGITFRF